MAIVKKKSGRKTAQIIAHPSAKNITADAVLEIMRQRVKSHSKVLVIYQTNPPDGEWNMMGANLGYADIMNALSMANFVTVRDGLAGATPTIPDGSA